MTSSRPWRATVAPISESTSSQRPTSVFRNDAAPPARVMISSVESPPSRGSSVISAMTTLAPSPAKPMAIARPIPELAPVTTAIFPASRLDMGFDSYKDLGTRAPSSKDIPVSDVIQPDLDLAASLFEALSGATRRGRGIVRDSYGAGAFGLLDPACLSIARSDNGLTLEATLKQRGFDPQPIRERRRLLDPARIRAYLELHIEQGPTLVARGLPAAVVSGIRGCKRFRNARCTGEYAHSGAVSRPYRRDAVAATVAFLHHMEAVWVRQEEAGADLVLTAGELYTDPTMHGPSKIAGETRFVLDLRSLSEATMDSVAAEARGAAARISSAYRVHIDLGATSDSPPAVMDPRLRSRLMSLLDRPFEMASGAGHDAAIFAKVGIPSAMIFVRNEHGSHNPDEAMSLDDFAVGSRSLLELLVDFPF